MKVIIIWHQNLGNHKIHSAISWRNPDWTTSSPNTDHPYKQTELNLSDYFISNPKYKTKTIKNVIVLQLADSTVSTHTYGYIEIHRGYCMMTILPTRALCAFRLHDNEMAQQIKVLLEVHWNLRCFPATSDKGASATQTSLSQNCSNKMVQVQTFVALVVFILHYVLSYCISLFSDIFIFLRLNESGGPYQYVYDCWWDQCLFLSLLLTYWGDIKELNHEQTEKKRSTFLLETLPTDKIITYHPYWLSTDVFMPHVLMQWAIDPNQNM